MFLPKYHEMWRRKNAHMCPGDFPFIFKHVHPEIMLEYISTYSKSCHKMNVVRIIDNSEKAWVVTQLRCKRTHDYFPFLLLCPTVGSLLPAL